MLLIVEDHDDTRLAYEEFFNLLGFPVASASTGAAALRIARERAVTAILLDVTLPDVDGRDLCNQLRQLPNLGAVPIMALTGHALSASERRGFDALMRKPVDLDALAKWLGDKVVVRADR